MKKHRNIIKGLVGVGAALLVASTALFAFGGSLSFRNYGVSEFEGNLSLWMQAHVLVEADVASEQIALPFPKRFVGHLTPQARSNLVVALSE